MMTRTPARACPAILLALLVGAIAAGAEDPKARDENQKIESLIKTVEGLKDAKFVRNGQAFDAKSAAEHMRRKWQKQKADIHTARDFIRLAASSSSQSGKPYLIRFKDGKEVESANFLGEKLDEMEGRKE